MLCNLQKSSVNTKIYQRTVNESDISEINLNTQNQLVPRPSTTRTCRYNDPSKDKLPSSSNYVDPSPESTYTPNVGYYKTYFSNIDTESKLLLVKSARVLPCPPPSVRVAEKCLQDKATLEPVGDPCFHIQTRNIWNNNSKRRFITDI